MERSTLLMRLMTFKKENIVMRNKVIFILALLLCANSSASFAKPGAIIYMKKCPGDEVKPKDEKESSTLVAALLTPLLTGTFKAGVSSLGEHLSEKAKEKKVDSLHSGDYFYSLDLSGSTQENLSIGRSSSCLLIATKSSMTSTKTNVRELLAGYKGYVLDKKKTGVLKKISVVTNSSTITNGVLSLIHI